MKTEYGQLLTNGGTSVCNLKRKDASPPVFARDSNSITGQLALCRFKWLSRRQLCRHSWHLSDMFHGLIINRPWPCSLAIDHHLALSRLNQLQR